MTKQFEDVRRGTLGELRAYYEGMPARGEVVLVIGPPPRETVSEDAVRERVLERVRALRASGVSSRDAAATVALELGVSKNLAYRLAQEQQQEREHQEAHEDEEGA
jgi:16S rRNA (cytidine1402-2'-O)-methyltransferase